MRSSSVESVPPVTPVVVTTPPSRRRRSRLVTAVVWVLVVCWGLWALWRTAGWEPAYPGGMLLPFTPYVAAASVIPVAATLLARRWIAAATALVVVAVFAGLVLPRAMGSEQPAARGPVLRVLTVNLSADPGSAADIVALVRHHHVDVVSLQEAPGEAIAAMKRAGLKQELPHGMFSETGWPSALYSRYPLRKAHADFSRSATYAMPAARIEIPGAVATEVKGVHVINPVLPDTWQAELLALPGSTPDGSVRILAGDFNATLDHAAFRTVVSRGYADAADQLGKGLEATWPAGSTFPPGVTIDHVLVDHRVAVQKVSVHDVRGTDHRALLVELRLPAADVPGR